MALLVGAFVFGGVAAAHAVDWNSSAYRDGNVFYRYGYAPRDFYPNPATSKLGLAKGNCTWYAHGRARELGYTGTALDALSGNAGTWGGSAAGRFTVDNTPSFGAIAESSGHVAFVERVNGDGTILISESSWADPDHIGSAWDYRYNERTVSPTIFLRFIHVLNGTPPPPHDHVNPIAPCDPGFTRGGTAAGWESIGGGLFNNGIFTHTNVNTRDNWARWTFDLTKLSGTAYYKVEAYITSAHAGSVQAHYHINTSSGVAGHSENQNVLSNQWGDLGTYAITAGSAWVELDDASGESRGGTYIPEIAFDAIRLTYVGPVVPPVQPAALSVVGPVTLSSGPYAVGDTITGSFVVKNTGGQSGTWTPLVLAFRGPSGQNRDAVASAMITLAPGASATVRFSRQLDLAGNWTAFVSGQRSAGVWHSPAGATVAFPVAARVIPADGTPTTPSTPASVKHGVAFTTYGFIIKHTAGAYPVTLQFYRYEHGHWVLRKSSTGLASTMLTFSKYRRFASVPYSGQWRVRARHNVGSHYHYSGYRTFTAS